MVFGPTIGVSGEKCQLLLRPIREDEVPLFANGLSSHIVTKYDGWGGDEPVTVEAITKARNVWAERPDMRMWGIEYQGPGEDDAGMVGLTALRNIHTDPSAGTTIFKRSVWGRGIATAAYMATTWFACKVLALTHVRAMYYSGNEASRKALERAGYVCTGEELHKRLVDGVWCSARHTLLVNPDRLHWELFWEYTPLPDAFEPFLLARRRTLDLLEQAETQVAFM